MPRYYPDAAFDQVQASRIVLCRRITHVLIYRDDRIKDIADELHVSTSTIRNVLNEHDEKLSIKMLMILCCRLGLNYCA